MPTRQWCLALFSPPLKTALNAVIKSKRVKTEESILGTDQVRDLFSLKRVNAQDFIGGFSVNLSESGIDPEGSKELEFLESEEPQTMSIANE